MFLVRTPERTSLKRMDFWKFVEKEDSKKKKKSFRFLCEDWPRPNPQLHEWKHLRDSTAFRLTPAGYVAEWRLQSEGHRTGQDVSLFPSWLTTYLTLKRDPEPLNTIFKMPKTLSQIT